MAETPWPSGPVEAPRACRIVDVLDEDAEPERRIRSFFLPGPLACRPGQFIQVWLPGVDEKPFSISYQEPSKTGFTVEKVGAFTERLFEKRPGDFVGIRGPYGNGFDLGDYRSIAIVSGGCGCAPTAPLAERAHRQGLAVTYLIGARSRERLIFRDRMEGQGIRTPVATDDGSVGHHGLVTDVLLQVLDREPIEAVFGCGPERMLKRVFDICRHVGLPCQLSLERYMKCAIGVCGSCALDGTGWLVCKDGPVFSDKQLACVTEFGAYRRNAAGRAVPLS